MGSQQSPAAVLNAFLERHRSVQHIACQIVTYGNVVCMRYLPLARARAIAEGKSTLGVLHPLNRMYESSGTAFPQMEVMTLEDDTWVPDWSTLRPSAADGMATVMCFVYDPSPSQEQKSLLDPGATLARAERQARQAGVEVLVGFEVEFVFLDDDGNVVRPPGNTLCLFSSTASRSPYRQIVFEAIQLLESGGVGIWGFHPENAGWEIASSPVSPLTAVDNLVCIHETLREVAYKHGMRVSFYPTHGDEHTAGQHTHLSVNGANLTAQTTDHWLAGMLEHLPAATAFINGGIDSYDAHRRFWAGNGTASWSRGKFGAIRRFGDNHFEVRLADTMCNPYLQLAAIVQAGLDGVRRQVPLSVKSLDIVGFVEEVPQEKIDTAGIKQALPTSLGEALDVLEKDRGRKGGLSELMGEKIVDAYLVAKRFELEVQGKLDFEKRRKEVMKSI